MRCCNSDADRFDQFCYGNKKITINKTSGKVTVKKGLKKGKYKIKVLVTADGDDTYLKGTETKTFTIKVR